MSKRGALALRVVEHEDESAQPGLTSESRATALSERNRAYRELKRMVGGIVRADQCLDRARRLRAC